MKRTLFSAAMIAVVVVPAALFAQAGGPSKDKPLPPLNPSDYGTVNFNTNVGSFKILGAAERKAEGRVEVTCKGTVLISGLEGKITPIGLRREINDTKLNKQVYFGSGSFVVEGKFSGIQWFGRDMKAKWHGWGLVRLFGEFDKNLNTGEYWYEGDTQKRPWFNGGMTVTLPKPASQSTGTVQPRIKDKG